ncbi:glutamine amidotransferase [candidate division TA06 bacterium DG_24]|uniref:Glutamine--fructose-6-phosphate aminotransferase [isomerizing] n=3 Tax=Bacteria division TA06 TaxID=1156500 RepID=A0A0S8JHE9_UNCT6|nr:MAG: glutamine amidotransferase [candidate division TA06 bacterium DG_24]KPK68689.1 MAG: glutamine amidotransferase [candidate division TA06 bacterium SM23_40]KPL09238.1 MAG: glutamine amidotransferase [candidate division TA06 bacterium SM1_40]
MCGIVGYIGKEQALPILLEGLKRLEYRGYDSAGVAAITSDGLMIEKKKGRVSQLESLLAGNRVDTTIGIAHTRWATHGVPSDENAHPHLDCAGKIAVIHNGIIENYLTLKAYLKGKGHTFRTDTDTEILAHLIEEYYDGDLLEATRIALSEVEGTYGLAVLALDSPREIVAARNGSPLVVGDGDGEYLIASDVAALLRHTNRVVYLQDGELVHITDEGFVITTLARETIEPSIQEISWNLEMIEKGGFAHFMLKEIFEQPVSLRNAVRGRLDFADGTVRSSSLNQCRDILRRADRIILSGCGTSWHASLIGEYMIEELARVPVEVEYASEFRYRSPVIDEKTVFFSISQSGETADTLAAMREAKRKGATVLGICNVVGSTIARESDGGIYIHAGPEIGVASTKAFTSQVVVLGLIAVFLGRMRGLSADRGKQIVQAIDRLPEQVERILETRDSIKEIAHRFADRSNFLFLGRGYNFPVALEGALKMKEISYIHAEGYPAAEMKHGPIALIDENMPVVFIAIKDSVYGKIMSNIEEVKSRRGIVIALASESDGEIGNRADYVIKVPETLDFLTPLLTVIPLQLLAYYMAVARGCDVDKPRNLAKSVTVE